MITTLRTKMLIGVMPLLALMLGLGLWAITLFSRLGNNIDVILRENYRSVRAAQGMKEALERMDSALWFAIGGREDRAREQYRARTARSSSARLKVEQNNVTLAGRAADGRRPDGHARPGTSRRPTDSSPSRPRTKPGTDRPSTSSGCSRFSTRSSRRVRRRARHQPAGTWIDENVTGPGQTAESSTRVMLFALLGSAAVASMIAVAASRAILEPIRAVTRGARAMAKGRPRPGRPLDHPRRAGRAGRRLQRHGPDDPRVPARPGPPACSGPRETAQATIDSFPDPVDRRRPHRGSVERANPAARQGPGRGAPPRGRSPGRRRSSSASRWPRSSAARFDRRPTGLEHAMGYRDDGQERFFLPHVPGHPRRGAGPPGRGDRPDRRHTIPAARPAQERHGLHRQPRIEDAADRHPDDRSTCSWRRSSARSTRSRSSCSWRPGRTPTDSWR